MRKAENRNAPWLGGWLIAIAAGLVAFGVLLVVGKFDLFPSAALGGAIALIVGLILGMPWGASESALEAAPRVRKIVPQSVAPEPAPESAATLVEAAVPPAAAMAAPVTEPARVAEPAAFVAMPAAAPKPKAPPKPKAAAKPQAEPKPKAAAAAKPKVAKPAGPERLKGPRKGQADDLKEIEGIGPAMEKLVNGMGFYHFDQIASWSEADVALVDGEMQNFKGRITRDKWVAQAKIIVTEGLEAFRERAKTNNY